MKCRCKTLVALALFACAAQLPAFAQKQSAPRPPTAEEKARGTAMLDTFAAEFMPKTHDRYKQLSEKYALTSKTLANLETSIRENGGDPANDETYKTIQTRQNKLFEQVFTIQDFLFGHYCYQKMEVFASEELLERDAQFAAWVDAEYLTKKAAAPKGE